MAARRSKKRRTKSRTPKLLEELLRQNAMLFRAFGEFRDDVNKRFDDVDKRFDGVDKRLDGVDQRLGRLEDVARTHSRDLKAIHVEIKAMNARVVKLEERASG